MDKWCNCEAYEQMIFQLEQERDRLRGLIGKAWDAGAARTVGSHELMKQIHPSKTEWMEKHLEAAQAGEGSVCPDCSDDPCTCNIPDKAAQAGEDES